MAGMIAAAIIAACAVLNRLRGLDTPAWLPGRALYYVAPAIAGLALLMHPWPVALALGASYAFWAIWPWGRWFDLGHLPGGYARDGAAETGLERFISSLSGGNDYVAMFLRHLLAAPAWIVLAWAHHAPVLALAALPFSALIVAAYWAGWRLTPKAPIQTAELLAGALWGALIALS